jgi:hypothetical protein
MEIIPNEEFILKNYNKILGLINGIFPDGENKTNILNLFGFLGDRYTVAPASSRSSFYSSFPGGLCYHTLNLVRWVGKLSGLLSSTPHSKETLLLVCLLAELGKVGDLKEDYYIQAGDWQRKNGTNYIINPVLQYMRPVQRSLYLAQHFNIRLTSDEYIAILLQEGQHDEANSSYKFKESELSTILHFANIWSQKLEKHNKINW